MCGGCRRGNGADGGRSAKRLVPWGGLPAAAKRSEGRRARVRDCARSVAVDDALVRRSTGVTRGSRGCANGAPARRASGDERRLSRGAAGAGRGRGGAVGGAAFGRGATAGDIVAYAARSSGVRTGARDEHIDTAAGREGGEGEPESADGGNVGAHPKDAGNDGRVLGRMHTTDGRVDRYHVHPERPAAAEAVGPRRYDRGVCGGSGVFSSFRDGPGSRAGVCGGRLRSSANGSAHQRSTGAPFFSRRRPDRTSDWRAQQRRLENGGRRGGGFEERWAESAADAADVSQRRGAV